jgi:RNA recognition motif-containing protein
MKIYVGALPYSTTDKELMEMFSDWGEVSSASIVKDTYAVPAASKGYGFVEMPNAEEAKRAIDELNYLKVGRFRIVVCEERPLKDRELIHRPSSIEDDIATFTNCILGPDGKPLNPDGETHKAIIIDFQRFNEDLFHALQKDPSLLYQIPPRAFEELVADLLNRKGYDVTLTPASKDGGKDIYAARRNELGSFLYIVECKRYSATHKVTVELVRQLFGVVTAEKATAGILATTSFFTRAAKDFQCKFAAHQISLKDYNGILDWLQCP